MKNIILNIGSGYYQVPIIKQAKKLGYRVITCDINSNAPGLKHAYKKIIVDCHDHKQVYEKIKKYNKEIAAIVSGATRNSIYTTSFIAKKLRLIGLNTNTAKKVIDKKLISQKFNKKIFLNINQLNKEIHKNNFKKIIVKNNNISGQNGIKIFNNIIKNKKKIIEYCNKFNQSDLSLEKFIEGKHFVITGIFFKNKILIYSIIYKRVNKNLKTQSLSTKSKYIDANKTKIIKYVKYVLKKINFDKGPFQLEIFMDKNMNFYVGEIEPSITGSYITEKLIPYSTGTNFIKDTIKLLTTSKFKNKINKIKNVKIIFKNKKNNKKYFNYENCKYAFIKSFPLSKTQINS